ncbi:rhoptry kinase family protein rop32 [Cystoisospora suis]|uniref:Rhoptry kinase family protein rop32 n=1 Tax=Cystoisospora suis TaxID=483139 RepID=A0A2C6JS46_9APIC|nr:rhoptry kinase family protein rop32 [Cystoisospora suis]
MLGATGTRQFSPRRNPWPPMGRRRLAHQRQQRRTAARRRKVQRAIEAMKASRGKSEAFAGTTAEQTPSGEPEEPGSSWEIARRTSGGQAGEAGPSWGIPGKQYSSERSPEVVTRQGQEAALEEAIYSILRRAAAWVYSQPSVIADDEAVKALANVLGPYETFKVRLTSPVGAERQFMRGRVLGAGGVGVVVECWDTTSGALYACKIPLVKPLPGRLTPERVTWGLGKAREEETAISSLLGPTLTPEVLRDAYGLFVPWFAGSIVEISGAPYHNYLLPSAHSRPFYNLVVGFWPAAAGLIDVVSTSFIPLEVTLFIVRQIVRTVAALHSLGVVHGDIKVDNFLVGHNGGIYLGDFGTVTPVAGPQRFRPPGTVVYLDPQSAAETLEAGPSGGARASIPRDTWALGLTVYLLLCHRMPFEIDETGSRETTLRSIIEEARRQKTLSFDACLLPEDHAAAPDLHAIINHMLARKPGARTPPHDLVRQFPFLNLPLVAWAENYNVLFTDSSLLPAQEEGWFRQKVHRGRTV